MSFTGKRVSSRVRRHRRIRKKIFGIPERPRLAVYRSNKHLFAQLIDDTAGKTLLGRSTKDKRLNPSSGATVAAATELGKLIAKEAQEKGVKEVVFDRGGYLYHGRIKAFADAVRAEGVKV